MSLQVWLPLNGDITQQGLSSITMSGSPNSWGTTGKIGKCATFAGSTSNVIYNNTTDFNYTDNFSWAIWVNTNYTGTAAQYIFTNGRADAGGYGYGLQNSSTTICTIRFGNSTWDISVTNGVWTHLVFTKSGTSIKIYKNGTLYSTNTFSGTLPTYSDGNGLGIGCFHYSGNIYPCYASINDFRIYDHCLSPKEIKELAKGLILHYKLDGKDETTTNLITTEDCLSSTAYNASVNKYGYNADSNLAKTVGDFNGKHCTKVTTITAGVSARPYVYFSNIFVSNGTNQPAYKTLSFDYYGTIGTYLNFYKLGSGNGTGTWKNITLGQSGSWTNSGNITVEANKWNHIELTLHGTTDANAEFGYCILGDTHTTAASNYWLFANGQLEIKDHATPYVGVGGSRTYTTEYDCSGYRHNGDIVGTITSISGSPRYNNNIHISATNQKIHISGLTTSGFNNSYSFSWWAKCATWSNMMHWGFSDGIRLNGIYNGNLWNTGDGSNNPLYNIGTTTQVTVPSVNEWHHFVMTGNGSKCYVYKDGVLWAEAKTYKTISGTSIYINGWDSSTSYSNTSLDISDFRIYATALSADDVKELYQTSASIGNNGTVYAYELEEV